jgi:predicted DNA-binding protein (MmcQ/YjbR family)
MQKARSCRGEVMKRAELESFIMETYNAETDYPWLKYPNYEVFRHCNNRKWFALIMDVPKNKLGLQGEEMLKVVDFKCDPILIGTLREEPGFFPAYHMSKDSWITVVGGSPVGSIQYELIDKQFDCMAKYLSWDMLFKKSYYATARDELEKNKDSMNELEWIGKNL